MSDTIRLVVCQLECHPALYRDRLAYLEEPFVPESYETSLSYLGAIGLPITTLQENNRAQYIEWQKKRLESVLSHPLLNEDVTTIIAFPEGSVPVDCLKLLHSFASSSKKTIVAGSHTILDTIQAEQTYSAFGKAKVLAKPHTHCKDVTFVFDGNRIHHQKKKGVSPFDRVDVTPLKSRRVTVHPIPTTAGESSVRIVTLVCADALLSPNIRGDYDVVCIISYDQDPSHFDSYIGTQVGLGKAVMYCNDGRFGGSSIALPLDNRPKSWFFNAPMEGRLPKGDAILIIDIATGELATQVGVLNPKAQCSLGLVASITYANSVSADKEVSQELNQIRQISNNEARHSRLNSVLKTLTPNNNQKYRVDHLRELARTGLDGGDVWSAYGTDLVTNLTGLVDLEGQYSKVCRDELTDHLIDGDLQPNAVASLQAYLRTCRSKTRLAAPTSPMMISALTRPGTSYINRENEIGRILEFFDNRDHSLMEITGLPQIGKSAIISEALRRTALTGIKKIPLLNTSSAEYILSEIATYGKEPNTSATEQFQPDADLSEMVTEWDLIWLENCQNLTQSGKWRSAEIEKLIQNVVAVVQKEGVTVKVIFESAAGLPLDLPDPSLMGKLRIWGFERDLVKYGVLILDRQLRNLGLSPKDIDAQTKTKLVKDLGGHPLAIVYCANAIYDEGLSAVIEALKMGGGFYREVTDRILNVIALSDNDVRLLRILSGCRIEAPRDAIANACAFPATEAISNLIRLCLIEVSSPDTIRLPGLLRNRFRFADLESETRTLLHKSAASLYGKLASVNPSRIEFAVEAEYHAASIGQEAKVVVRLIDGRFGAAKEAFETRRFAEARKLLQPLLSDKASADVVRLSALIDARLGDLEPALQKAEKVLQRNSWDNYFFSVLGKATLTQNRPELGDRLVHIGRITGVTEASVSLLEGRLALRRRDFEKAEICFRHAISSPRTTAWAYYYLGYTYMRMGDVKKAIDVLYDGDLFLANKPAMRGHAGKAIRAKLGVAYVLNGNLEAATQLLDDLISEDPDDPEILYAFWLLTIKRDGVEKAEEAFEVFRSARPRRWQKWLYHLYYGLFYKALGQLVEANEHFELAHQFESSNVYVMMQYAETLYALARQAKTEMETELALSRAIKCAEVVQRILEFDPDNHFAENLEVDLYYEFDIQRSDIKE